MSFAASHTCQLNGTAIYRQRWMEFSLVRGLLVDQSIQLLVYCNLSVQQHSKWILNAIYWCTKLDWSNTIGFNTIAHTNKCNCPFRIAMTTSSHVRSIISCSLQAILWPCAMQVCSMGFPLTLGSVCECCLHESVCFEPEAMLCYVVFYYGSIGGSSEH